VHGGHLRQESRGKTDHGHLGPGRKLALPEKEFTVKTGKATKLANIVIP
jgi:hypothetical protein